MKEIQVLSMRGKDGARPDPRKGLVRIDRQTPYGNPFVMKDESQRADVIRHHAAWLMKQIAQGKAPYDHASMKDLAAASAFLCWCHPRRCHGDALAEAALKAASTTPVEFRAWAQGT